MVNPIASVNAKSLLTVELTIAPTNGEPNKFLISEGCKFTNLKYLDGGKEVVVSGVCKVIRWNYIKLPEKKNDCVHDTTSTFATQCIPTSMVVDCSGEFSSDIREIPILAVRGCDKIEDANGGEVNPKPPVGDDDNPTGEGVVARVTITGTVDPETGVLSDAVVTVALNEAVADEDVEEFLTTSTLTIVTAPSEAPSTDPSADDVMYAKLNEVNVTWDDTATFKFDTNSTFDLAKIKEGGAAATLQVGELKSTYALTEEDVPEWTAPEEPVTPPEETVVEMVSVEAVAGELIFVLSGVTAENDPTCVILNDSVVLKGFVGEDGDEGQRIYTAPISGQTLKATNNVISIHGEGYHVDSEQFAGLAATVATDVELSSAVTDAVRDLKTQLAACTTPSAIAEIEEVLYVRAITGIPGDLTVTGIMIGDTEYHQDDDEWVGANSVYGAFNVYTVENGNVSLNTATLLRSVGAEGTVDVRVHVANSVGRSIGSDYVINNIRMCGNDRLTLSGVTVVDPVDGFVSTVSQSASGITLNREHTKTGVAIPVMTSSGNTVEGSHVFVFLKEQVGVDSLRLMPLVDGKINLGAQVIGVQNHVAETEKTDIMIIADEGVVSFSLAINDTVRPALAIADMAIDGTIDYDGIVTDYDISFAITPTTMTKTALANASLNIYGTAINGLIGEISTNIDVTNGIVTVTTPLGSTLDVSAIKSGTVAILTVGDETAVAQNVSVPTYYAPVPRSINLVGTPDFETGMIASGTLNIKFDREIDISKMKIYATPLGFDGVNLGTMAGVTTAEDGTIVIPVTNLDVAELQKRERVEVTLKRGSEGFNFVMLRGSNFPTWVAPPVVQRVELCGTPDKATGMIAAPVIKVTFDKVAELSEANVSIAELGLTNIALTGEDVLMVGAVANVTLTSGVSVVSAPTDGITATVVNKTMVQTYAMVADTDYPTWTAPAVLTRVEVIGTVTNDSEGNPQLEETAIKLTYDKPLEFTSGTVAIGELLNDNFSVDGVGTEINENVITVKPTLVSEEDGTVTVTTLTCPWENVPETGLVATVTVDGEAQTYTMVKDTDYPVQATAEEPSV